MNLEIISDILYVEGYPAFKLKDGDPITPTGCSIYFEHKDEIDTWLKQRGIGVDIYTRDFQS